MDLQQHILSSHIFTLWTPTFAQQSHGSAATQDVGGIDNHEELFVQCSECDGFVKLSDVEYTDYEEMLCVLIIVMKKWCCDTGAPRRLVSLLIMTQVTAVPISSLSTMEVNVDDW